MSSWTSRRPRLMVLAGFVAAGVTLAGCSGTSHEGGPANLGGTVPKHPVHSSTPVSKPPVVPATLTSSVQPAAKGVPVDTVVTVTADHGTLTSVVLRSDGGATLAGTFNSAKTKWTA